jgi:hypothetical protein
MEVVRISIALTKRRWTHFLANRFAAVIGSAAHDDCDGKTGASQIPFYDPFRRLKQPKKNRHAKIASPKHAGSGTAAVVAALAMAALIMASIASTSGALSPNC